MGLDLVQAASARLEEPRPETSDARARVAAARDFRDGLIIALLALRPLRVKNLLGIEIGRHLRMSARRAAVSFAGTETKTRKPIDHSWPPILVPHLERYLAEVRPIMLTSTAPVDPARPPRPAGSRLWVGQGGTALTPGGLQKALQRHTKKRVGRHINAHAFRMNVASTIAGAAPGRIDMAQALLGHAKPTTTEAHYVLSTPRLALRGHHDLLASIRKSARRHRKIDQPRGI